MSEAVNDLSLIEAAVSPVISTSTSDLILTELSLVFSAVLPDKFSFAMQKTMLHFTLKDVAFTKFTSSLAVVYLANLNNNN
jgi:putative flippase GtrA